MRISEAEKDIIVHAIHNIDTGAVVWLFGSRTDDNKKGGDIDIAVLSNCIGLMEKIKIKNEVTDIIGQQKIDIVCSGDGSDPFFRFAVQKGLKLTE
jgi:predicted nucleotidyltransferase